jgi:hypothetical protein
LWFRAQASVTCRYSHFHLELLPDVLAENNRLNGRTPRKVPDAAIKKKLKRVPMAITKKRRDQGKGKKEKKKKRQKKSTVSGTNRDDKKPKKQ